MNLPSANNLEVHSYSLLEWLILYERVSIVDYLVKRLGVAILHKANGEDALSFAIKNSKYIAAQHLLNIYSQSFDLTGKNFKREPFLKLYHNSKCVRRSVCYLDLLDYSHLLEQMFKNYVDSKETMQYH